MTYIHTLSVHNIFYDSSALLPPRKVRQRDPDADLGPEGGASGALDGDGPAARAEAVGAGRAAGTMGGIAMGYYGMTGTIGKPIGK